MPHLFFTSISTATILLEEYSLAHHN